MATVSFSKITPIKAIEDKIIDINGEKVSVKQYLPIAKKAEIVGLVLQDTLDEHGMNSNIREKIYTYIRLVQFYTNINITDTMLDNAGKTYDLLEVNHILEKVIEAIPQEEYEYLINAINTSIKIVSDYRTSVAGLFTDMQAGDEASVKSADELMSQLQEVSQNGLLKNILEKMG